MSNENTVLRIHPTRDYLSVAIVAPMKKRGKRKPFIGKEDITTYRAKLPVTRYPLGHDKEGQIEAVDISTLYDLPFYTNPFAFSVGDFAFTEPMEVECALADLVNGDYELDDWKEDAAQRYFLQMEQKRALTKRIEDNRDHLASVYEAAVDFTGKSMYHSPQRDERIIDRKGFSVQVGGAKLGNCYRREEHIVFTMGHDIESIAPKGNGNNWSNQGKIGEHPLLGEVYKTSCSIDSSG